MKTFIYKLTLFSVMSVIGLVSGILFLNSCSKSDAYASITSNQDYVENNLLNRDIFVSSANDDGADITDNFNGYTFRLTGTNNGAAIAKKDTITINGSWALNYGKDKIVFDFPPGPGLMNLMGYFNKEWMISKGSYPVKLSAANGENDVVYFAGVR